MLISEIYHSVQGEGALTGTPSFFVRTSGCNLRCEFCDTPYASWNPEGISLSGAEIIHRLQQLVQQKPELKATQHIVLTGGEPLLPKAIVNLCDRFHELGFHITIETAGTIFRELKCDLMSISPKFGNSTPSLARAGAWRNRHEFTRFRPLIVNQLINHYPSQLKFVVEQPSDIDEILEFLRSACSDWRDRSELSLRVMLMPQGIDLPTLRQREIWLKPLCAELGLEFCPRRHIEWYGNNRGT
jgi:7-carboxy-7-deazaguanine synthase